MTSNDKMSYFTELFDDIRSQMELLLNEWKEDHRHDNCYDYHINDDFDHDCDGYDFEKDEEFLLEKFFLEYTNSDNSLEYYIISDDDLNDSYREGSAWVLKQMNEEYGLGADYISKTLTQMSEDNIEYAKHLIYWISHEIKVV